MSNKSWDNRGVLWFLGKQRFGTVSVVGTTQNGGMVEEFVEHHEILHSKYWLGQLLKVPQYLLVNITSHTANP